HQDTVDQLADPLSGCLQGGEDIRLRRHPRRRTQADTLRRDITEPLEEFGDVLEGGSGGRYGGHRQPSSRVGSPGSLPARVAPLQGWATERLSGRGSEAADTWGGLKTCPTRGRGVALTARSGTASAAPCAAAGARRAAASPPPVRPPAVPSA